MATSGFALSLCANFSCKVLHYDNIVLAHGENVSACEDGPYDGTVGLWCYEICGDRKHGTAQFQDEFDLSGDLEINTARGCSTAGLILGGILQALALLVTFYDPMPHWMFVVMAGLFFVAAVLQGMVFVMFTIWDTAVEIDQGGKAAVCAVVFWCTCVVLSILYFQHNKPQPGSSSVEKHQEDTEVQPASLTGLEQP
eukprot:scaffold5479_cov199-Amphora_coffeaeformis.AAC.33